MVDTHINNGYRIAELLASEITGHKAALAPLSVVDADPDVTPTEDGAFTYHISHAAVNDHVATVYAHVEHIRVVIKLAATAAAETASDTEVCVCSDTDGRPSGQTIITIDNGAEVKRSLPIFESLAATITAEADDIIN
jgi:hypothetical protein